MNTQLKNLTAVIKNFRNKEYRDLYVENHIKDGLAFQIRGMRKGRRLSQSELADKIDTEQSAVSRLEDPDYGRYSIDTLMKLASAFDVALLVRFITFGELADRTTSMNEATIDVPSYNNDRGLKVWAGDKNVQLYRLSSDEDLAVNMQSDTTTNEIVQKSFGGENQPNA